MERRLKRKVLCSLLVILAVLGGIGFYQYYGNGITIDPIEAYQPARDRYDVERLFAQNWFWLINIPYEDALASFGKDLDKVSSVTEQQKPEAYRWIVYREGGVVKGFCTYYIKSPTVGRILFLAVGEKYRGHGCAQQLMQYAISALERAGAKTIRILVRIENFRAQNLYRKLGFEAVKTADEFIYMERYGG